MKKPILLVRIFSNWRLKAFTEHAPTVSCWATVCKTVRPMLSVRCLSVSLPVCPVCLSVCDVRALWPNGWTDQDETWHAGKPRPWPHCVRRGRSFPSPKGAEPPKFSAHVYCGQTAGWMKVVLGMEVGLSPGDIVLDGDPVPFPQKGAEPSSPIFGPFLL